MAAETGNSAAVPGSLIPLLTLAIPGSAAGAVLLAAMIVHGVTPGPMILFENPDIIFQFVAMVFCSSFAILLLGTTLTRPLLLLLKIPQSKMIPLITVLCIIGSYALANRMFDVWVMVAFGFIGYGFRLVKFPLAPLVLGIVLGPILDKNFRRGMVLSDGQFSEFFMRPISMVLCTLIVIAIGVGLGSKETKNERT